MKKPYVHGSIKLKKKINGIISSPEQSSCELMPWRSVRRPSIRQLFLLNDFFSKTSPGIYSKLGTNVPYGVTTNCCYYYVDPKSNMAAVASDWLTHFRLLLKNGCRNLLQTWQKYSLWGSNQLLYYYVDPKSNMAAVASD